MGMYPSDEPYTPEQTECERNAREAEILEDAQLAKLKDACPILRRTLLPEILVVWEEMDGEMILVCPEHDDQPRVEIRWEQDTYIAQAYGHDALLKDMVDADPVVLALTLKTYLAHAQMEQFLSASAADFYNRR